MALLSMRRFGPLFRPAPVAEVRRVNSISSASSASLIVSREKRLGASRRGFQQSTSRLAMTKAQKSGLCGQLQSGGKVSCALSAVLGVRLLGGAGRLQRARRVGLALDVFRCLFDIVRIGHRP